MEILVGNFALCCIYALIIYGLLARAPLSIKNRIFTCTTFIQLTIVHGFVDVDAMPDLPAYSDVYQYICRYGFFLPYDSNVDTGIETGYKTLMWLHSFFTKNFQVFLVNNSVLMFFFYYKCFFKYSPYLWFSVLLLLLISFNQSTVAIRQHLSIACALMTFPYIITKDIKRYMLMFMVAWSLHASTIVFFPVYFLYNMENRRRYLTAVIFILVISLFIGVPLANQLGPVVSRQGEFEVDEALLGLSSKGIIMLFLLSAYVLALRKHALEPGINKLVLTVSMLGIVGNTVLGAVGHGRLFLSYYIIMMIQAPITLAYIHNYVYKFFYVVGVLAGFFAFAFFLASDLVYWVGYKLVL